MSGRNGCLGITPHDMKSLDDLVKLPFLMKDDTEIVVPDTGAHVPDGETEEVVFTSLMRQAIPARREFLQRLKGLARHGYKFPADVFSRELGRRAQSANIARYAIRR